MTTAVLTRPAPPPSTLAELGPVLLSYDRSRPRARQTAVGPSELGTRCVQQLARKLAGAPRKRDTVPPWAPIQGGAVHTEMEHVLAHWNAEAGYERWLAETTLQIDAEITGRCDAYDTAHDMAVDWKHAGKSTIGKLATARRAGKGVREQLSQDYRVQAHLYALGHLRAGRDVKWVRVVFLAREADFRISDEWTEEFIPEVALAALDRYYAVAEAVAALTDPDHIGTIPATPGDGCYFCPFRVDGQPADWYGCPGRTAVRG